MPYLLRSGAEALDMALVTHLHTDHYKGLRELGEIYPLYILEQSASIEIPRAQLDTPLLCDYSESHIIRSFNNK